jgi:hypothetical protein
LISLFWFTHPIYFSSIFNHKFMDCLQMSFSD